MKKLLIFLITVFSFANIINKDLLFIEAKIYPKIIMLINNLNNKNKISIAIIANKNNFKTAKILKKFMKNSKLKIDITTKVDLKHDVYILTNNLSKKTIEKLVKHKKILFSVSPKNINISMFSIYIGAKVYPYINPYLIKKANIKIDPIIFKVGKIYE